jgi:hypothetical protein
MQGRLILDTDEKRDRARRMGIQDPQRKYLVEEMASGDVLFAATGVTDGSMLDGVRLQQGLGRYLDRGHAILVPDRPLDQGEAPPLATGAHQMKKAGGLPHRPLSFRLARQAWIAEIIQSPPRRRTKVHTSVFEETPSSPEAIWPVATSRITSRLS